ncbi:hypothetical protein CCR85_07360 [Rhodothalassium salexigens]|uniref:twin transmembrane helix small protein n=1 Tax=Rhodothalassium salexigens TaxID=1086 RepID=UPI0019134203|nr:twin transmembrane helix small protein [Rhodothalassium salexigens]MBK5911310.1 hypothetical protein [Rhodothalassium salexigens]MBK5921472.1 hypothetical protein [Rhodothalassium salexigens]
MNAILTPLILIAMFAALVVVFIGVLNMARSKDPDNPKRQNKLMQLRVAFQAIALLLAFIAFSVLAG